MNKKSTFTISLVGEDLEKFYKLLNYYSANDYPTFISIFRQLIKDGYDKAFPSNKLSIDIIEKRGRKPSELTKKVKNLQIHASLFIPKEQIPNGNLSFLVGAMIRDGKRISHRATDLGWIITRKS